MIDAGEGARPQTHEHLEILRLLGIERGVVAVTKADAVGRSSSRLPSRRRRSLCPAPKSWRSARRRVSGSRSCWPRSDGRRTGRAARAGELPTRLWVDRAFTISGAGTVATGTLWSGSIGSGDVLRVEPGGREVRVRTVEVHDARVERAEAGQRVAVALPGSIATSSGAATRSSSPAVSGQLPPRRGLSTARRFRRCTSRFLSVRLAFPARVVRQGNYAQLRLSEAVVAARGDRVVLRAGKTVGGGRVLDPAPPRGLDAERLEVLRGGDPVSIVRALTREPQTADSLRARGVLAPAELARVSRGSRTRTTGISGLSGSRSCGRRFGSGSRRDSSRSPLDPGLSVGELLPRQPWAAAVVPLLGLERRDGKAYLPGSAPALGARADEAARLEAELDGAEAAGAKVADAELARYLEREGRLVRLGDGLAISRTRTTRRGALLVEECEQSGSITLARFRDLLGSSRRPAQLLLERFDADGVTRRVGDERVLRRGARS